MWCPSVRTALTGNINNFLYSHQSPNGDFIFGQKGVALPLHQKRGTTYYVRVLDHGG